MDEILAGKVVLPTAQGHLLARDPATSATSLCDPRRNGDKIHLPPLRGIEDGTLMDSYCLLAGDPTAPGCVVLLVDPDDTVIRYVHHGDDQWVEHDYDIGTKVLDHEEDLHEKDVICPIAACRGKFYFNSLSTELGVLEFCPGPVFSFIEIDDTIAVDGSYGYEDDEKQGDIHLVEDDRELYMVTLFNTNTRRDEIYGASVHRMDFVDRRWCKVNDLWW